MTPAVAVRTSNLAVGDLRLNADETNPITGKLKNGSGLRPDVVEIQDADIGLPAVSAWSPLEVAVGEGEVSGGLVPLGSGGPPPLLCTPPPPFSARASSPVTVDANDFAFIELSLQGRKGVAHGPEAGHVPALASDVVELEDNRILLAAVSTSMRSQVLPDEGRCRLLPLGPCHGGLLPVPVAAPSEVQAKALAAPPLSPARMTIECGLRQLTATTTADAGGRARLLRIRLAVH